MTPLSPLPPVESRVHETPLPSAAPDSDRHLLILVPGTEPEEEAVKGLARVAALSVYDARLALSSRRPRMFRRLDNEDEARCLSRELTDAGLAHYVVAESAVLGLPVVKASGAELSERHLNWRLEGSGRSHATPVAGLLLLVTGEITRERHHEKRVASVKSPTRRLTSALRLHLYEREAGLAIEIDPESFEFALLGAAHTRSAHLNFQRLVSRLSELAPEVEVDRGFDWEPVVLARSGAGDVTDALAQAEGGPDGVLYDNEAAFRFYARWRYRLSRHLSRGAGSTLRG